MTSDGAEVPVAQPISGPAGYEAARLIALSAPLDSLHETAALMRAARRLRDYLGLELIEAERIARRCVLLQRDRRVHETLILHAAPESLGVIADTIPIDGLDRLAEAPAGKLLVAFHYGPYSSLLWLALVRAAATGRLGPLTFLLNRELDPNVTMPSDRWAELVAHGVITPEVLTPFERGSRGPLAARELAAILASGGSVLLFPDAWFLPPGDRTATPCRIGRGVVGFPRGVDWLARRTGCQVVTVRIFPDGNGHRIALDRAADVAGALQVLGNAVAAAPEPWEGWIRDQPHF